MSAESVNLNAQVLACLDGASHSQAVCDYAIWIAKSVGAPLCFLHAIEPTMVPPVADWSGAIGLGASEELLAELTVLEQNHRQLLVKKGNIMLQAAKQKALDAGVQSVTVRQVHDGLAPTLIAEESQIRILLLGIRGEAHEGQLTGLGEQLETIIRSLHKPILVINTDFREPKNLMLAYDGSEAAVKALDMVAVSSLLKALPCHLIHVSDAELPVSEDNVLQSAQSKLEQAGITVHSHHLTGAMAQVLTEYQHNNAIDLLVMGAFSHSRLRTFLLGSLTVKMLQSTQTPMLLLR